MFKKPPKKSKAIPIVVPSLLKVTPVPPSGHHTAPQGAPLQHAIPPAETAPSANGAPVEDQLQDSSKRTHLIGARMSNCSSAKPGISNDEALGFNIYARPFVPQAYLDINQQTGAGFLATRPKKIIDFAAYAERSLGPTIMFLPPSSGVFMSRPSPLPEIACLGPQNYKPYFDQYLNDEAAADLRDTEAFYLYGHELTVQPSSAWSQTGEALCSLQVPGLRENTPFVEEEDVVELRQLSYRTLDDKSSAKFNQLEGWTQILYHARIANVIRTTETVVLRIHGLSEPAVRHSNRFNVKFTVPMERRLPMLLSTQDAHHAVSEGGWLYSILFPSNHDCEIQEQLHPGTFNQAFFDQQLNWEQKKAVESILSRSYGSLPYLVSGPPGTGKTKTIIETALQLIKRNTDCQHILLCAPSDPAADTLCQRLIGYLTPDEMLRLTRPYRTFAEVSDRLLPYCCIENDMFALPPFQVLMKYRVVVTTCRDANLLTRAKVSNRDLFAVEKGLRSISEAIHPFQSLSETKLHWSAVLIDEAAQAMEPEALIPLNIVAPPRDISKGSEPLVVMAGDEYQLGPKTLIPSSPLQESLFARLSRRPVYANHPLARGKKGEPPAPLTRSVLPVLRPAFTNLIRNYRSHPAILAVPSNLFYWDTLEPEATDTERLAGWDAWRGRGWPVLFHDNASPDELELPGLLQGNGGWYNRGEADIACSYAQSLVESGRMGPKQVCIMSPFKAQVRYLRQCMRDSQYGRLWDVNIGPMEAFQGLESGVVILCITRANRKFVAQDQKLGWGIIGTPNKMNVALTRAKFGLIVVGSRELLIEDPNWKAFVDFCDRNGLVAAKAPAHSSDDNSNGDGTTGTSQHGITRLEGVLIDKERHLKEPTGRAWGMLHGVEQGSEMWSGGMVDLSRVEGGEEHYDESYEYASEC